MNKQLICFLCFCYVSLFTSFANAQQQPVLVIFPVEVDQQDARYAPDFGSALQQGLAERYDVYYGPAVEKELQKEYQKLDCSAESCRQNLAIAFNGELIGLASAKRFGSGYVIKWEVHNVFSGKIVESKTQLCRHCEASNVLEAFQGLGSKSASVVVVVSGQRCASADTA